MSQTFRILTLVVACFIAITCTNASSRHSTAEHKRQAARGPASVKKKNVKIERRGLYIAHKSLMHISKKDRIAYYTIFVNFARFQRKMARKKNKYAQEDFLKNLLTPSLEAVNCHTSAWSLDNGLPQCTFDSSNRSRPEDSPEWATRGIVELPIGHCQQDANRDGKFDIAIMPCPVLGLNKTDGTARIICSDNRVVINGERGHSLSCVNQFDDPSSEKGTDYLVNVLDRCEDGSTTIDGINCAALTKNADRAVTMYKDNCDDSKIVGDAQWKAFMKKSCQGMFGAVDAVAKAIGKSVNPANRDEVPEGPTCRAEKDRIENNYNPPTGNQSSSIWSYMLEYSANVCGRNDIEDRREMASMLGDCSIGTGWSLDAGMKADFVNPEIYKKKAASGDATFSLNFGDNFGLSGKSVEKLFCNKNSAIDLSNDIKDNIEKYADESKASWIPKLTYEDLRFPSGSRSTSSFAVTKPQFDLFKSWFSVNSNNIHDLASGDDAVKDNYKEFIPAEFVTEAKAFVESMKGKKDASEIEAQVTFFFDGKSEKLGKQLGSYQKGQYRSAFRQVLLEKLTSPRQADRTQSAVNMMKSCADSIVQDQERKKDRSADPAKAVTNKCFWQQMGAGVFPYFVQRFHNHKTGGDAKIPPYFLHRKDTKACYGAISDSALIPDNMGYPTKLEGIFVNRTNGNDKHRVTLDDTHFSKTSEDTGELEQNVLVVYRCNEDPKIDAAVSDIINGAEETDM